MKINRTSLGTRLALSALLLLGLSTLNSQLSTCFAQGTAFTYQGRLNDGASPANGSYDLTFTLFGTNTGGSAVAGPLTNSPTGVTNGLFTVTLDFGSQFNGNARWLEMGVRTNGSVAAYTILAPRQQLTPTPYAIYAAAAGGLPGLIVLQNATSPSLIGGYSGNVVPAGTIGATIGGGGAAGQENRALQDFATVSGGYRNLAEALIRRLPEATATQSAQSARLSAAVAMMERSLPEIRTPATRQ